SLCCVLRSFLEVILMMSADTISAGGLLNEDFRLGIQRDLPPLDYLAHIAKHVQHHNDTADSPLLQSLFELIRLDPNDLEEVGQDWIKYYTQRGISDEFPLA